MQALKIIYPHPHLKGTHRHNDLAKSKAMRVKQNKTSGYKSKSNQKHFFLRIKTVSGRKSNENQTFARPSR